ncbi:MAG: YARHG domain-containing protein [Eubacteriales bacterium]
MFCPHCGKQIPDDSNFCPECGGRVAGENETGNPQDGGYDQTGNYGNPQDGGYDQTGNYGNPPDDGYGQDGSYGDQENPYGDYDDEDDGDSDRKKGAMLPIIIVGCVVAVAVIGTIAYFTLSGKLSSGSSSVSAPSVSANATPTPVAESDTISIGVTAKPTPTSTPTPTVKATPTPIPTATLAPTATPTPVPTATPVPATAGYDADEEADPAVDALINVESSEYLDYSDLSGLSEYEVKLVRNGLYARHGYIFSKDPSVKAYFESKSWYQGTTDNMDAVAAEFNSYENANLQTIVQYERDHKYNGYTN